MSKLPYSGFRVIELSQTLSGRLAGLLFADQGAEVFIEREPGQEPDAHDEYLDRNKTAVPPGRLADTTSADVIVADGDARVDRLPAQILLRITAALPGDEAYGHLAADCSEDLRSGETIRPRARRESGPRSKDTRAPSSAGPHGSPVRSPIPISKPVSRRIPFRDARRRCLWRTVKSRQNVHWRVSRWWTSATSWPVPLADA